MVRSKICSKCNGPKDVRSKFCLGCRECKETDAPHGDDKKYWSGCRCDLCKAANSAYALQRKKDKPEMALQESRRYQAKNKDRLNAKRRSAAGQVRQAAASTVKRRLRNKGVILDYLTDVEKPTKSRFLVYGLVDPVTLALRYVGVSSSGLERPKQHRLDSHLAHNDNKRKDDWIKELKSKGLTYAIRVLEYFDTPEQAHAAEPYWIQWARDIGEHIYNQTAGNDSIIRVSEATKQKMREKMTGRVITWGDKISKTKKAAAEAARIAKLMPNT